MNDAALPRLRTDETAPVLLAHWLTALIPLVTAALWYFPLRAMGPFFTAALGVPTLTFLLSRLLRRPVSPAALADGVTLGLLLWPGCKGAWPAASAAALVRVFLGGGWQDPALMGWAAALLWAGPAPIAAGTWFLSGCTGGLFLDCSFAFCLLGAAYLLLRRMGCLPFAAAFCLTAALTAWPLLRAQPYALSRLLFFAWFPGSCPPPTAVSRPGCALWGAFCGGLAAAFWRMGYLDPGLVLAFGLMSLTVALLRRRSGPAALFFS